MKGHMKKTRVDYKYIVNYLSIIISKAIFVILLLCAFILAYYFISLRIYSKKGEKYGPPFSIYTIVSASMTPKIKVYDVIINVKAKSPADIRVGDIITFKSTSAFTYDMTITHRVIDVQIVNGEYEYITKGDFNEIPDMAPAKYSNVIGIAKVKLPQLGRIQVFVASKYGWLLVVVVPALYIIISDILKLIKLTRIKKVADQENRRLVENTETNTTLDNPVS